MCEIFLIFSIELSTFIPTFLFPNITDKIMFYFSPKVFYCFEVLQFTLCKYHVKLHQNYCFNLFLFLRIILFLFLFCEWDTPILLLEIENWNNAVIFLLF